jgi:hypothetical protein
VDPHQPPAQPARDRPEALKALTRLQHQVDQRLRPKSAITVAEAIEQWLEVAKHGSEMSAGVLGLARRGLGARPALDCDGVGDGAPC